jgi:hypothetical protein
MLDRQMEVPMPNLQTDQRFIDSTGLEGLNSRNLGTGKEALLVDTVVNMVSDLLKQPVY